MNHPILQAYERLVPFLGDVLGSEYEIVLHQVSKTTNKVIAIANGHLSGRDIGAPLTDLALSFINDKVYETQDSCCNYKGISKNGKIMRSSTFFIKDNKGTLLGMLCFNYDTSKYTKIIGEIGKLLNLDFDMQAKNVVMVDDSEPLEETFVESVSDLVLNVLQHYLFSNNLIIEELTAQDKKNIVEELKQKNIFKVKGAVGEVAQYLNCSIPTVYRYLNELK